MPQDEHYKWYVSVRRYRDKRGRFVAGVKVIDHVNDTLTAFSKDLKARTQALMEEFRPETFAAWATSMRYDIRTMHNAMAIIALGGKEASLRFSTINATVWEEVDRAIGTQMQYFDRFLFQTTVGAVNFDGTFADRASMYAEAGHSTYENAVRMRERVAGMDEERRIINSSRSCSDCLVEAAQDWQPMGTLRRIGDSQCGGRCRCYFQFRKTTPRSSDE